MQAGVQNAHNVNGTVFAGLEKRLSVWHNTYLSVTSMLALKAHLHSQELPDLEQAKFNVMHTTFTMAYIHENFYMMQHYYTWLAHLHACSCSLVCSYFKPANGLLDTKRSLRVLRLATISLCRNLQWGGAQLTDQRAYITTDNIHKPRARAITTQ